MRTFYAIFGVVIFSFAFTNFGFAIPRDPDILDCGSHLSVHPNTFLDEFFKEQAVHTPTHAVSITLPAHFKPTQPEWGRTSFRTGGAVLPPEPGPNYRGALEALGLVVRYNQNLTAYGGVRYTAMGTAAAVERVRQYVIKINAQQKETDGDAAFISSVEEYFPAPHEKWTYATLMNFAGSQTAAQNAFLPLGKAEGLMVVKNQLETSVKEALKNKNEEPFGQLTVVVYFNGGFGQKLKLQGKFSHLSQALTLLASRESIVKLEAETHREGSMVMQLTGVGHAVSISSTYLSAPSVHLPEGQTYADIFSQKPLIEVVH